MKKVLILFFVFMSISFVYSSVCPLDCFEAIENPDKSSNVNIGPSKNEPSLQRIIDKIIFPHFEIEGLDINVTTNQSKIETWNITEIIDIDIYEMGGARGDNHSFFYYFHDGGVIKYQMLFQTVKTHDNDGNPTGQNQSEVTFRIPGTIKGREIGFALCKGTETKPTGCIYTEHLRNNNGNESIGKNRSLVYDLSWWGEERCGQYLMAFEDASTDYDFNDLVVYMKLNECIRIPRTACSQFTEIYDCVDGQLWTDDLLYRLQDFFPEYQRIDPDFCFNLPTKWQGVEGGKEIQLTECGCYWSSIPNNYGQQCFEKVNVSVRNVPTETNPDPTTTNEECKLTNLYPAEEEYDYNRVNWTLNPNNPGLAGCYNATRLFGMPSTNTLNFFNMGNFIVALLLVGVVYIVVLKRQ